MLGAAQGNLLAGLAVLHGRASLFAKVLEKDFAAHHAKLLWGYGQMEQSLLGSRLVEEPLKNLGELRVATLVGCPF